MKIFGWNITRTKNTDAKAVAKSGPTSRSSLLDAPVSVKKVTKEPAESKPIASLSSVKSVALSYMGQRGSGRGSFIPSEYDLSQLGRIEDTDGYVRQAFSKKLALMFKEGYDIVGPNTTTVKYVKTRLAQISKASSIPTDELLRSIGAGLIKKSNAFLVKVRKSAASGGKRRTTPEGKDLDPVAGYFVLPPETMSVDADDFGRVRKWRQTMPNGDYKEYKPEDIVHFTYDRKEGFLFGTPVLIPVIDDIRALRKIEENVELLVYQHLFPLFHYIVGTEENPAGMTEEGEHEVDVVRRTIQYMPSEGGIVTPERHEIRMIGAEGKALQAENYIEHFKKRIFSGMGISAVDMGEGETANRATAETMSQAMVDSVKDFQAIIETQFNQQIIQELLLESTFGDNVLEEENVVRLRFSEIDTDKRMRIEKHALDSFSGHALTHPELRQAFGKEPIALPSDSMEMDEDTDLTEWNQGFWKLIEEPKALIQAVDEPFSPGAQAAAANPSTSVTPQHVSTAGEQATAAEVEKIKAKPKPVVRKSSMRDAVVPSMYDNLEEDIVFLARRQHFSHEYIASLVETQSVRMYTKLHQEMVAAFLSGFTSSTSSPLPVGRLAVVKNEMNDRAQRYINRLMKEVTAALSRNIDMTNPDDRISTVRSVFSSLRYRADLISDVETRRARNWGTVTAWKVRGVTTIKYDGNRECPRCQEQLGVPVNINDVTLSNLAPFHGDCNCIIQKGE